MRSQLFNLKIWFLTSLTLGLAPFFPEPHIWGKIKWLIGGGNGMSSTDYFDVFLHGFPWVMLIITIIVKLKK
jgi:hypothetical protein